MKIDMAFFPTVKGSMTSADGRTFMLHVDTEEGAEMMLGFPHRAIDSITESAAMQAAHGKDIDGEIEASAFVASGFELGRGPER
jgi:hypothetical protein